MLSPRFCPGCGAANEPIQRQCFACGYLLSTEEDRTDAPEGSLLHGRYRLSATLGSGGFSAVYRARDTRDGGREVALKQITLRELSADQAISATDTFNREVALLSTLDHPQVPRIYDHFSDRDHWYLVLEYIPGSTLETYLEMRAAQDRSLSIDEALDMAQQLCTVLGYLHRRQPPIIFRDLKPGNIMRTPAGKLSLIDFGIARRFRREQRHDTQPLGSPGYAAPEQYGRARTTPQTDLYSLGVLLFALLSRQDPAQQSPDLAALRLEHEVGGAELVELMQRMLARDPNERPASPDEVASVLAAIQQKRAAQDRARIWLPTTPQEQFSTPASQQHIQIQLPAPAQTPLSTPVRRFNRRGVLIGAVAVAAVAGGAFWWQRAQAVLHSFGYSYTYKGHTEAVSGVAWSPAGARIASVSQDTTLQIWSPTDENNVLTLQEQGAGSGGNGVTWSPAGSSIAAAYGNAVVQVWDSLNGKTLLTYDGHARAVNGVAWSPDSALIASCSDDATAQVWSATEKSRAFIYRSHTAAVLGVTWAPDSTRVASASADQTAQIWNAADGHRVAVYRGHTGRVNAVAWSPDGAFLASASDDQTVHIWDAASGNPVFIYQGHTGSVHCVAWSPDSRRVASGSFDTTAHVWNARDGRNVSIYRGHTAPVNAVAWSPDGASLASASSDETVQVWKAPI